MKDKWRIIADANEVMDINEYYLDKEAVESFPIYERVVKGGVPILIRAYVFFSHNVWKGSVFLGEFSTYYRGETAQEVEDWVDKVIKDVVESMYKEVTEDE